MYFDITEFGARLKDLRTTRGLTQEKLAEELGISWDHLCRVERGNRSCSIDLIIEIAVYFGVSTDYLLLGKRVNQVENRKRLLSVIGELTELAKNLQ
ncbi:helix-turn-helix domain-containing protein [Stomatobaculum longum]|uniref:helix-turn-helix domain-containing protein n=1 Tax=Stomatobaculum longum TaxID=796942 RepID=UPI0028EDC5FF|nr:helix-turn-helix transcriptional regulator [Stomatobaculum longum]